MSDFKNRVEQDLGHIADRASPSPTTWDAIQSRIAEQVEQPEVEIIMLDSNHTPPRRISTRTLMLSAAAVVATVGGLVVVTRSSDEPATMGNEPSEAVELAPVAEAPITMVIQVDFDDRPIIGTFEVTEGADVLQCSTGSFVERGVDRTTKRRIFTCDSGPHDGTFNALWNTSLPGEVSTQDDQTWSFEEGTGDFVGLQGGGEWSSVDIEDQPQSVETYVGVIGYGPVAGVEDASPDQVEPIGTGAADVAIGFLEARNAYDADAATR